LGLAQTLEHLGQLAAALDHAERALRLCPPGSRDRERAWALNSVGWLNALRGDHESAITTCREALAILEEQG
jgi:tetratricopeptide (TPR) repeat protein